MSDTPPTDWPELDESDELDEDDEHAVPPELIELHEVIEWAAAVEASS